MKNSPRDYLHDIPVLAGLAANRARTGVASARYRLARYLRIDQPHDRYRRWLYGRAAVRGKAPLPERVAGAVPVYRDRVNPATGRPWRDPARTASSHRIGQYQAAVRQNIAATRELADGRIDTAEVNRRQDRTGDAYQGLTRTDCARLWPGSPESRDPRRSR